jgi:hypothetical protein
LEHPLYVSGEGWRAAQLVEAGRRLDLKGGAKAVVISVDHESRIERVYNLEVAASRTYVVTPGGLHAHNISRSRAKSLPTTSGIYVGRNRHGDRYTGRGGDVQARTTSPSHQSFQQVINHPDPDVEIFVYEVDLSPVPVHARERAFQWAEQEIFNREGVTPKRGGWVNKIRAMAKRKFAKYSAPCPIIYPKKRY